MKKDTATKLCLYIDKELVKKIKLYCVEHNISMSNFIEKIMKERLK